MKANSVKTSWLAMLFQYYVIPGTILSWILRAGADTQIDSSTLWNHNKLIDIVSALLTEHFSNFCDLFFLNEYFNKSDSKVCIQNEILKKIHDSPLPPPTFTLALYLLKESPYIISPSKSYQCSVTISFLHLEARSMVLYEKFTLRSLHASTRPQSDYYIFMLPSIMITNFFKSKISHKLKYKLVIPLDPLRISSVVGQSVCMFCGAHQLYSIKLDKFISLDVMFPDWTKNGHGHSLRVSTPTKYPFVIELERVENNKWKLKRGSDKLVVETLLAHFNFTMRVLPSTGGDSGKLLANGTWSGVMGDIMEGRADLGLSTSYNLHRYELVGFSHGFQYVWGTFNLGPPKYTYSWMAIFWPFAWNLWFAIGVSLGAVIVAFRLIQRNRVFNRDRQLSAIQITFALVGREVPYPTAISARLLLCIWLFSCLVLSTLYVAKIVCLLAFPVVEPQPTNFIQLVDPKMEYKWGIVGGGNLYAHFETSTNPVLRKIFNGLGSPMNPVECLKRAMQSKFACITWKGTSDYISHKNFTILHGRSPIRPTDEDKTLFVPLGMAMEKSSVLLPTFNRVIQMLVDAGQTAKWVHQDLQSIQREKIHWEKSIGISGNPLEHDDGEPDLLSLYNLIGVFYMFLYGVCISGFAFFVEMLYTRCFSSQSLNDEVKIN